MTTPRLAWSFFSCADASLWGDAFVRTGFARAPEADHELGVRRYEAFAHDWRVTPAVAWLGSLGEAKFPSAERGSRWAALVVLNEEGFGQAVRDALRNLHRPASLRTNPLSRSRIVAERSNDDPSAATPALQAVLREAVETLRDSPRERKLYRALDRTYLQPAATQELAAESLGLPFSTYRRHLKRGVGRVLEILWRRELQEPED